MKIENNRVIEAVRVFLVYTWRVRKLDNGNGRVAPGDNTYRVSREL